MMSSGDLFKRGCLLPQRVRRAIADGSDDPARPENPAEPHRSRMPTRVEPDGGIFNRPTVVPKIPTEEFARVTMAQAEQSVPPLPPKGEDSEEPSLSLSSADVEVSDTSALGFVDAHSRTPRKADRDRPSSDPAELIALYDDDDDALLDRKTMELPPDTFGHFNVPNSFFPDPGESDAGEAAGAEWSPDEHFSLAEALGGSLDSVPPPPPSSTALAVEAAQDRLSYAEPANLQEMYAVGDYSGALDEAERRLELNPSDEDAQNYAENCRGVLEQMLTARLGDLTQRVEVLIPREKLRWLSIDHRAGFILSMVDAQTTIQDLLDIAAMPRLEALRIVTELAARDVIGFGAE